eukprot:3561232-Pleurochrysis_carterae.AAC.1
MLIMIRNGKWLSAFNGTWDASEWALFSDTPGIYVANTTANFHLYTKVVEPGSYLLDTYSALYLFGDAHGLSPT